MIGATVYARADTPVHSLLHEAGHLIVLPPERRAARAYRRHRFGRRRRRGLRAAGRCSATRCRASAATRVLADMDAWGYTFRLGSARAYVEHDAADAWRWLREHGLVDAGGCAHPRAAPACTPEPGRLPARGAAV